MKKALSFVGIRWNYWKISRARCLKKWDLYISIAGIESLLHQTALEPLKGASSWYNLEDNFLSLLQVPLRRDLAVTLIHSVCTRPRERPPTSGLRWMDRVFMVWNTLESLQYFFKERWTRVIVCLLVYFREGWCQHNKCANAGNLVKSADISTIGMFVALLTWTPFLASLNTGIIPLIVSMAFRPIFNGTLADFIDKRTGVIGYGECILN